MRADRGASLDARAHDVPYRPPQPERYDPNIALVGCGQITEHHLEAYRESGFTVAAF
jgi:hypothetical protein